MIQQMDNLKLAAQKRAMLGTNRVARLRKSGWLPGVVYDANGRSLPVQVQRHALEMMLRRHAGQNLILDLELEGEKARKVLLKDTQRDHLKDHLLHADFLEISMSRKLRVAVAIRLVGEPLGVSLQSGVMEHLLRSVEVECLPADIVQELPLDVSNLSIGDTLAVRDLKVDPKLTILTAPEITVVSVQIPHFEEEKPAEEAAEAAAEGAPVVEGAAAAAPAAEPGKEKEAKGKETAKEAEPKEKGKETREKAKEPPKGKETKEKAK